MKFCPGCKVHKEILEFPRNKYNKSGLHHYCKLCACAASKMRLEKLNSTPEGRQAFLEKERVRGGKRKAECKQNPQIAEKNFKIRKRSILKQKYGLNQGMYDAMYAQQEGKCAICKNPETKKYRITGEVQMLGVDHNHSTGKVRELLCDNCNVSLGRLRENPDTMIAMAAYVRKHKG